jgi:signal peptidase I
MRFWTLILLLPCLACSTKRYKMPSGSMIPTIEIGTTIVADRNVKTYARGEVYVFDFPEAPTQQFIKRILGMPGDHVETKGRAVWINGKPLPSCEVGPYTVSVPGESPLNGTLVLEGSPPYLTFYSEGGLALESGTWDVKPGEYFMMGDNRNNSHDSRYWFGGVGAGVGFAAMRGRIELPSVQLPPKAGPVPIAAFAKCMKQLAP